MSNLEQKVKGRAKKELFFNIFLKKPHFFWFFFFQKHPISPPNFLFFQICAQKMSNLTPFFSFFFLNLSFSPFFINFHSFFEISVHFSRFCSIFWFSEAFWTPILGSSLPRPHFRPSHFQKIMGKIKKNNFFIFFLPLAGVIFKTEKL